MKLFKPFILWSFILMSILYTNAQEKIYYSSSGHIRQIDFDTTQTPLLTPLVFLHQRMQLNNYNAFSVVDSFFPTPSFTSVRMSQTYKSLPVEGANMIFHYNNSRLFRYIGHFVEVNNIDTIGTISSDYANTVFQQYYQLHDTMVQSAFRQKVILENPDTSAANPILLCYKYIFCSNILYIDAATANIVEERSSIAEYNPPTDPIAYLYTDYYGAQYVPNQYDNGLYYLVNNNARLWLRNKPGNGFYQECNSRYPDQGLFIGPSHTLDAFYVVDKIVHYFKDTLEWNSYDNEGSVVEVIVNYPFSYIGYNNAGWAFDYHSIGNGKEAVPGPFPALVIGERYEPEGQHIGGCATFDILAHEFGHGFDQFTSRLYFSENPEGKSLSEGVADIWGCIVESAYAPYKEIWKSGEDVFQDFSCGRNIANPEDPLARSRICSYYQDEYYNSVYDSHLRGGVVSHWFYKVVEGLSEGSCALGVGIGMSKAAKIFFYAQRTFLAGSLSPFNNTDFISFRLATIQTAELLYGENSPEVLHIINCWTSVGLFDSAEMASSIISDNVLWDTPQTRLSDVFVTSGAILTITDNISFMRNRGIIVEPGGTLIINGGTLTSACPNEKWKGIIVKGIAGNDAQKGRVLLGKGSSIENAETGIYMPYGIAVNNPSVGDYYTPYNGICGNGMTIAVKSLFVNNLISIKASATEDATVSCNVDSCSFVINDDFCSAVGVPFKNHIYLENVKGVNIVRSHFSCEKGLSFSKAIMAHNSGFTVNYYCDQPILSGTICPPLHRQHSTFRGFNKAIVAENYQSINTFSVKSADFMDNNIGIEVSGVNNEAILECNFQIGRAMEEDEEPIELDPIESGRGSNYSMDKSYGIKLNESSGYRIEENYFVNTPYSFGSKIGSSIKNSGVSENLIYKNEYFGLDIAQEFIGINNGNSGQKGVKTVCNTFTNTISKDIEVLDITQDGDGLRVRQDGISNNSSNAAKTLRSAFCFFRTFVGLIFMK
ncbi:MAG: M4 family metallopeptidase [Bacteroidales bacterium]|nr:M4 family metallopeptidase [Bacteroidales bacterium]